MHPAWKPRKPEWAPLAPGVRWLLKPMDGVTQSMVAAKVARGVAGLQESRALLEDMGFENDLGALSDLNVMAGLGSFCSAVYTAEALLLDWEGMVDEDGAKVEVSPEAILAAFHHGPPESGSPLLEPFSAWVARPRMPVAADVRRLRDLSKWENGGGMAHCRGCDLAEAACAEGGTDGGARCPRAVNAPQTPAGIAALDATRKGGVWRRAGLSGVLIGLDYAACLAMVDAADEAGQTYTDRAGVVRCLAAIEAGALEAAAEKSKDGAN